MVYFEANPNKVTVKNPKKVSMGKKNRVSGAAFERKVRADLGKKGWIVSKWQNNLFMGESKNSLEWEGGYVMKAAKHQFNPFTKAMSAGNGFPDFIAYRLNDAVIGVECKSNGYLKPEEKAKCKWLIEMKVFNRIWIARKGTKRGEIVYEEFK